jgi:hypothetical protein
LKTISELFSDAWAKKSNRNWNYIYILVDLHGVVLPQNYHKKNDLTMISPYAEKCLKYLSDQPDVKLILWSSSYENEITVVREWLGYMGIKFSFVNENPLEKNTDYADFSKKIYFSICLDDKAGFEASDWESLLQWIHNKEFYKL